MSTLRSRALNCTARLLQLPRVRRTGHGRTGKSPQLEPQAGRSGEVESHLKQSGHELQKTGCGDLPIELFLQIFDHVPATDIIRYRAVSTLGLSRTSLCTNFE